MTGIKVSVIVPIYNVEAYLMQCLESLAEQTLPELEFLLVDDGSTDASGTIARDFAASHPRFRFFHQENKGYAGARNAALPLVRGEFTGFVDSDDYVEPEMFEKLYKAAKSTDAEVAGCSFAYFYQQDNVHIPFDNSPYRLLLARNGGKLKNGAEGAIFDNAVTWNKIYSTFLLQKYDIRFSENLRMAEDVPVFWKSYLVAKKITLISDILYHYRNQRIGQQVGIKDRRVFSFFSLFDEMAEFIDSNKIIGFEPYILHLKLSRFCYGYEKISQEHRSDFFNTICNALSMVPDNARIAPGPLCGSGSERMRFLMLRLLHPLVLRAIKRRNEHNFARIISLREKLGNLPRRLRGLLHFGRKK